MATLTQPIGLAFLLLLLRLSSFDCSTSPGPTTARSSSTTASGGTISSATASRTWIPPSWVGGRRVNPLPVEASRKHVLRAHCDLAWHMCRKTVRRARSVAHVREHSEPCVARSSFTSVCSLCAPEALRVRRGGRGRRTCLCAD